MKIAIMQPYLFPYIGYFQLISAVDKFVFYDDVNFIRQGWINRNNILVSGKKFLFSVPVKDISSYKRINEVTVSDKPLKWSQKLLQSIKQSYGRRPFFNDVYPMIEKVIGNAVSANSIADVASESVLVVLKYLDLNVKDGIVMSSVNYGNSDLKSHERVVDICKRESSDTYVNAIGGQAIYTQEMFEREGIDLFFLKSSSIEYRQGIDKFCPNLSIIDVLMNCSTDEVHSFLTEYELTKGEYGN